METINFKYMHLTLGELDIEAYFESGDYPPQLKHTIVRRKGKPLHDLDTVETAAIRKQAFELAVDKALKNLPKHS